MRQFLEEHPCENLEEMKGKPLVESPVKLMQIIRKTIVKKTYQSNYSETPSKNSWRKSVKKTGKACRKTPDVIAENHSREIWREALTSEQCPLRNSNRDPMIRDPWSGNSWKP